MEIGTKVVMVDCLEAETYAGKVWTVVSKPWECCGSILVRLEGYCGGFDVTNLEEVEDESDEGKGAV